MGSGQLAYGLSVRFTLHTWFWSIEGPTIVADPNVLLQNDDHASGLIRLLTIGLRVLTVLEFTVCHLAAEKENWLALCWESQVGKFSRLRHYSTAADIDTTGLPF